jgi:alkylated DNA repair dioxygenase AlkB
MNLFDEKELFNSGELRVQQFDLPGADLVLYEHFFPRDLADTYYNILLKETPWHEQPITIHGKTHIMPRLVCWYGEKRSGEPSIELNPTLKIIKQNVEDSSGIKFTSVLLNYYRDGNDHVSWHRDYDKNYMKNPPVASVSFGETRYFDIRHKFRKDLDKIRIPLNHGSLLVMAGGFQHNWEHSVPKTARKIGPRINLTFRVVETG